MTSEDKPSPLSLPREDSKQAVASQKRPHQNCTCLRLAPGARPLEPRDMNGR